MSEPLRIIGIDPANVGSPRNDGTPGSGLYAVPVTLSRASTPRETELILAHWDRPPQFTLMHRPGTASVIGRTFLLERTTIDEVRDYHASTLALVIQATNRDEAAFRAQDTRVAEQAGRDAEAHRHHVNTVADNIQF